MRDLLLAAAVLAFAVPAHAAAPAKPELKTQIARLSYAFGMEIGSALKTLKIDLDRAAFVRGLTDMLDAKPPLLTEKEAADLKEAFAQQVQERELAAQLEQTRKNREAGEAFLAANKKKQGVITTRSGLQYIVLRKGDGAKPTEADTVRVHYRGTLIDGREFDSSFKRGRPVILPVTGVIPGWTEVLQLMKTGSRYKVFIPANLAYGDRGAGPLIEPGSTLIFEMRLVRIEKREGDGQE